MADTALTPEKILVATEEVLRRYGPAKATVVDVARALGVSHGSVYRHFPTKSALREAVTSRWLDRAHSGLAGIAEEEAPAADRLRRWLATLFAAKKAKAVDDPELFATYSVLASEASETVHVHLGALSAQLTRIVDDGVASGEFVCSDATRTAQSVLFATTRFHHPAHAPEWSSPTIEDEFEAVISLLLGGISA